MFEEFQAKNRWCSIIISVEAGLLNSLVFSEIPDKPELLPDGTARWRFDVTPIKDWVEHLYRWAKAQPDDSVYKIAIGVLGEDFDEVWGTLKSKWSPFSAQLAALSPRELQCIKDH